MHNRRIFSRVGVLILYSGILLCVSCGRTPVAPLWEIADTGLSDLAFVRADPTWGTVVVYNPNYCAEIGEACGFFRTHAYAHVHLNHTLLASPAMYPPKVEARADCFVAKHGKASEVRAAVDFLRTVDPTTLEWKIYGDPRRRAEAIRECAVAGGNWIKATQ